MKAVVFGELIWDVYPEETVIGGAPFNFAAHLAHLGNEAYLITAVGFDELGEKALTEAGKHKIDSRFIMKNSYPTGACLVTLDQNKIPLYNVLQNVSYDNITVDDEIIADIGGIGADVFYFNTLIQRGNSADALLKILDSCTFRDIFTDINIRENCFSKHSLLLCLQKSSIVKISEEEAHYLCDLGIVENSCGEELLRNIAKTYQNLRLIILTLGKDGSMVLDCKSGEIVYSGKPENVTVVSTVGAGDCYGASFLSAIYSGKSVKEAVAFATERSNIVVANRAAIPF